MEPPHNSAPASRSVEPTHSHGGHSHGSAPPVVAAIATAICGACGLAAWGLATLGPRFAGGSWVNWLSLSLFALAYVAGGASPAIQAISSLRKWQLNVDLLMVVAALGAAAI